MYLLLLLYRHAVYSQTDVIFVTRVTVRHPGDNLLLKTWLAEWPGMEDKESFMHHLRCKLDLVELNYLKGHLQPKSC